MGQLVVRKIENEVKAKLQRRARRNGRSMEEEVREILRDAAKNERARGRRGPGSEIAALFRGIGFEKDVRELRGFKIEPVDFEE